MTAGGWLPGSTYNLCLVLLVAEHQMRHGAFMSGTKEDNNKGNDPLRAFI